MSEITLGIDPSASMSKARYRIDDRPPEWMMMESAYLQVEEASLELYRKTTTRTQLLAPEREAWLCSEGQYYVVGELAQVGFGVCDHLRYLKYETLIPKVMAMVGAIAYRKSLTRDLKLNLGLLLPYGEIGDLEHLEAELSRKLTKFSFIGQEYRVRLANYFGSPEGFGVLLNGRGNSQCVPTQQSKVLVLMIGYRNASYLLYENGRLSGETSDYGFIRMIEKVVASTSGYQAKDLVAPVYQAGVKVKKRPLQEVLRSSRSEDRDREMSQLIEAIKKARTQYLDLLKQWLESRRFRVVNEVILTGGTAHYYKKELEKLFELGNVTMYEKVPVGWAQRLESQLKSELSYHDYDQYAYRLTDIYGYFNYMERQMKKRAMGVG